MDVVQVNGDQESSAADESEGVVVETTIGPPVRPWLTIGLTLIVMITYVVVVSIVVAVYMGVEIARNPKLDVESWAHDVETNGDVMASGTWAGTVAIVALVLLFARVVSGRFSAQHLGLRMPSTRSLVRWIILILVFAAATDGLTWLLGREVVPEWMRETYAATHLPILLWSALLIAAPVGEELLFRGFLYDGLARSRLGPIGAAVIASLAWASIHQQYDLYGITAIFVGGLILAAARHFTHSVIPCIAMHAVMNLIATLEVALLA